MYLNHRVPTPSNLPLRHRSNPHVEPVGRSSQSCRPWGKGVVPARPYLLLPALMYRPVLLPAPVQVYRHDCPPRHSWELNPHRPPANRVAAPAAAGGVPAPGEHAPPPPSPKKHADPDPGSGAFLTPGSRIWDGKKSGSGSGMNTPQPGSYFREFKKQFLGLKYLNSFMWIQDPGWKKFGSGMEKIRIRDGKKSSSS
jgi:hypothetical protein